MTRQTVNILIIVLYAMVVIADGWDIHLIASIPGEPYASTQEFINVVGIVWGGILSLVLYGINQRR